MDPNLDLDLLRIYNIYERLAKMNFGEAKILLFSNGDLSYFYYWCLGHIGLSVHFLGFIASAILYGSAFFLVKKIIKIFNGENYTNYLIIGILFILFSIPPYFFSGIRSATAIPVFMLAILNFIDNKKKLAFFFCFLSVTIHFFMLPFVILCIINAYAKKKMFRIICWCLFIAWLLYFPLFSFVLMILKAFSNNITLVLAKKIDSYVFNWNTQGQLDGLSGGSRLWTLQRILLIIVTIVFVLKKQAKAIAENNSLFLYIRNFTILYLLAILLFSYNLVALGRYLDLGVFVCISYLLCYGIVNPSKKYKQFTILILCIIILLAMVAYIRESFVEFGAFVYNNVPSLFYRNLIYLLKIHS